jgi:hypothetical protein
MSRILIALALIAAPTSTAVAQTMSAETFKALMTEAQAAAKRAREQRLATVKAGGKPRSCPPEGSRMGSDEFMQRLGAIPAAERSQIDMTEATIRILAAKYPC